MNDDHLDQLISSHLHGTLTSEQSRDLEKRLLHSAADRERFWRESETHAMLHDALQIDLSISSAISPAKVGKAKRWFSWRPLTAAAAGIAFGMICTSLVFGYVRSSTEAKASRLSVLLNGSFEKADGRVASGFPSEFGKWSGDDVEIVSGNAKDGKQALRFVQAKSQPGVANSGAPACDVYQLVDLRPLKSKAEQGDTTLSLSTQFLDSRDTAGEKIRFVARLHLFAGEPDGLSEEWPLPKKEALATGSGVALSSGGSPQTWKRVKTRVLLPQEADFAVVHIIVNTTEDNLQRTTPAKFGLQFADDVRLTLKTQPVVPVRLTQR
jgi:hypothetical protein